jgi:hypothetical protein
MTTTTVSTTTPSNNETKVVSSFIKSASEKNFVKSAICFASGTYSQLSNVVKPACPEIITSKWEAAEQFIIDNQHTVVEKSDEYVSKASKFASEANNARVAGGSTDFILSAVERLVYDESNADETELPEDTQRDASASRIYGITGAVTKSFYNKAVSGLDNLKKRTSSTIVHVDLMSYANNVIDTTGVKPAFDAVAGLPVTVVNKFSVYAEPIQIKTVATLKSVHAATHDTLITPVKNAYNMYCKDGKSGTEVLMYLKNTCHVTWNDRFVVPAAAYLEVPNLHFSTLKPLVVEYASKKYAMMNAFGSELIAAATKSTVIPVAMFDKLLASMSDRYLALTGVQFHFSTAPLILYDLMSSKSKTAFIAVSEKFATYFSMIDAEKAKMD